jgi:hypothetical protein
VSTWVGPPDDDGADDEGAPTQAVDSSLPVHFDEDLPFSAILAITDATGIRSDHPFRHPRMLLGRTPENDVALNDQNISTRHCELAAEGGFFVVRDLGSANGTYVNEHRVTEARLKNGDVVRLGRTEIGVQLKMHHRLRAFFSGPTKWILLLLFIAAGGGVAYYQWRATVAARDAETRVRFDAQVRAAIERDSCGRAGPTFESLRQVDKSIGGRSVAIELVGERVKPSKSGRESNAELLALWRKKQELYPQAARDVLNREQSERDGLERVSRLGARMGSTKDRKISFWVDGLLAQRLAAMDALATGLQQVGKRSAQFADLVERFNGQPDLAAARDLAAFQVGAETEELLEKCEAEQQRVSSGVLGALNGLED